MAVENLLRQRALRTRSPVNRSRGLFSLGTKVRLARSLITKDQPVYVQFYVTARCNLACEQCNIIYANSDVAEISTEGIEKIAENLARVGVSIVLLTGGEPFVRKDLPQIVAAFARRQIHVRIQTNGLATEQALRDCIDAGARDISVSLDSICDGTQDQINGAFPGSWQRAIDKISLINRTFPDQAFAALGCVLAPRNLEHIPDLVRFATRIGWYVSLVPAHTTTLDRPLNFRSFDPECRFAPAQFARVRDVLDQLRTMRNQGYLLYDSDIYLEDIYRLVTGAPVQWRDRNQGVCDSPNLYFAIMPNGYMSVCCDWRLRTPVSVAADDFPERFTSDALRTEAHDIARACSGCLYGSYPEMTITARHLRPFFDRLMLFNRPTNRRLPPLTTEQMLDIAQEIRATNPALYS
jgi:hypothetical protein